MCYHYYVVFFAHLLILQYPDHHQNLISSSLYYSGPVHKISSQSVHNFLSNVVHRQTNKQTNRQTNQNLLYRQFGMCSPDVLYKLFNSYCMSLYGSQLWNYENKSGMDSLYVAWRKCVRCMFNIPCNTHCKLARMHCVCNIQPAYNRVSSTYN